MPEALEWPDAQRLGEGHKRKKMNKSHRKQHLVSSPETRELYCYRIKMGILPQIQHQRIHWMAQSQTRHKRIQSATGFEYLEVFAPTVRLPTVRTVLAIAAIEDWHLRSIDISHAYLNGEMDVPVYMEQPKVSCRETVKGSSAYSISHYMDQTGQADSGNKRLHEVLTKLTSQEHIWMPHYTFTPAMMFK